MALIRKQKIVVTDEQAQKSLDRDLKNPAYVADIQERRKQMRAEMKAQGFPTSK